MLVKYVTVTSTELSKYFTYHSSQVKPCLVDVRYEAGVGRFTGVWYTSFHPIGFIRNTGSLKLYVLVFRLKSECGGGDWRGGQ